MKNIYHLLKLNIDLSKGEKGKGDLISVIFSTIIYGTIIGLIVMFFTTLVVEFGTIGLEAELLVFLLFLALIAKIIFGTLLCVKTFFNNSQNEILARIPFTASELFISRLIFVFVMNFIFGVALLVPLLNIYGIHLMMPMSFYIAIPLVVILSTTIALLISTILSFPCAYIKTFLSNKFTLTLLVISAVFTVVFYGYMIVLNNVADISSSVSVVIHQEIMNLISSMSIIMIQNQFLSNILLFENVIMSLLLLLVLILVLIGIVFVLMKFAYNKMLLRKIGDEKTFVKRKSKNKERVLFLSLLKREFISIFRNTNFLFQYFLLLLATPVITFLSVESSASIAADQLGNILQNVVIFLVLCIFSVVNSSFAANSISREGSSFFLIKIAPLNPKTIITSKFFLSAIATFTTLLASIVMLMLFGFISVGNMFLILFYCVAFSIGNICFAIKMDLRDPSLQEDLGIMKSDKTSIISIAVGMFLSILLNAVLFAGVIFDFQFLSNILIASILIIYAALSVWMLYRNLDENFNKIII